MLSRATGGLYDVIFQDGGAEELTAKGNRYDRNRYGSGYRQTGFQGQVNGGCTEDHPKETAQQNRLDGQFGHVRLWETNGWGLFPGHEQLVLVK